MTWSIGIRQKRRKTGLRIIACPLLLSLLCLGQTQGTITTVVVTVPVVDMYSAPNPDADVVSQAIYGSSARALEERQGWVKIQTPDQYTGWLSIDTIRRLSETHPAHASSDPIVQVDSLSANLYREPDVTAHRPLLTVPFEAKLEVVSEGMNENERWLQVRLVDQRLAWIQAGDVNTAPRSLNIEESIALGRRFLGVTYTWGGRSSFGFDCSGFTQMLVRNRGINMPRDADLQAAWDGVTPIDRKELRAGDLLFFGSDISHITHTGMFIGKGEFIHDTTHGHPGVQISRLDDQPWTRLLVACRRIK